MRGNDILQGSADVMVMDSLTGNVMSKMLSSFNTGGSFEAAGYGYFPGIGEGYKQLVMIVSRASGAPVIARCGSMLGKLVKNKVFELAEKRTCRRKKAGLDDILAGHEGSLQTEGSPEEVKRLRLKS